MSTAKPVGFVTFLASLLFYSTAVTYTVSVYGRSKDRRGRQHVRPSEPDFARFGADILVRGRSKPRPQKSSASASVLRSQSKIFCSVLVVPADVLQGGPHMALHPHVYASQSIDPTRLQLGNRIFRDFVQHDFK